MKKQIQFTKIDEEKLKAVCNGGHPDPKVSMFARYYIREHVHIFDMDYDPNEIGGYKTPDKSPVKVPESELELMKKTCRATSIEWKEVGDPVFS